MFTRTHFEAIAKIIRAEKEEETKRNKWSNTMTEQQKEAIQYALDTMESVARDLKMGISSKECAQRLEDEAYYLSKETGINKP